MKQRGCLDDIFAFRFSPFLCHSSLLDIVCAPPSVSILRLSSFGFDPHLIYEQQLFPLHFSLIK